MFWDFKIPNATFDWQCVFIECLVDVRMWLNGRLSSVADTAGCPNLSGRAAERTALRHQQSAFKQAVWCYFARIVGVVCMADVIWLKIKSAQCGRHCSHSESVHPATAGNEESVTPPPPLPIASLIESLIGSLKWRERRSPLKDHF